MLDGPGELVYGRCCDPQSFAAVCTRSKIGRVGHVQEAGDICTQASSNAAKEVRAESIMDIIASARFPQSCLHAMETD